MPFHQLVVDLAGTSLDRAEEACTRLGAIAVSLGDAGCIERAFQLMKKLH